MVLELEVLVSVTYTEGGIGRKACTCGVFVPARSSKCPKCGHIFVSRLAEHRAREAEARARAELAKAQVSEESEKPKIVRAPTDGRPVLLVPSGRCPVVLEGTDLATVQMWVTACCEKEPKFAIGFTCAAQWARQFYSVFSEEYKTVVGHLANCRHLSEEMEMPKIVPGALQKVAS